MHRIIGKGPRQVVLPTRHLQLLKRIKISVMSGSPHIKQDQWVADLVKQFVKDGLRLETFEMTWFGWKRYHLRAGGLVCRALLCLDVEKYLVIKVTGELVMFSTPSFPFSSCLGGRRPLPPSETSLLTPESS